MAQQTKAFLTTQIATNFADNTTGLITPASLRAWAQNIVDTFDPTQAINPVYFGADPTGVLDSTAAFNSALSAGSNIIFPPGTFRFNSTLSVPVGPGQSITIAGSGPTNTTLHFPSAIDGMHLTLADPTASVHVREMTITTGQVAATTGINIAMSSGNIGDTISDVTHVEFRGDDGYGATNCWSTCLLLNRVSNININQCSFFGESSSTLMTGITISGLDVSHASFGTNVFQSVFNFANIGINLNNYANYVQINANSFNMNGGSASSQAGVFVGSTNSNCSINIIGNAFGSFGNGITAAGLNNIQIIGNEFSMVGTTSSAISVAVGGDARFQIIGNSIIKVSGTPSGINIGSGATTGGAVIGNYMNGLATGITIGTAADNFVVSGNTFISCSSPLLNGSSGATAQRIVDNPGYNPVGVTAAANVGASPATITAGPTPETHYINQSATNTGTVTKGSRQVHALVNASTFYSIQLGPNESYVVTWSATQPTYTKDVH